MDVLDPLDILLMEGNLLQGEDLTIIVFGSAADQILTDWAQEKSVSLPASLFERKYYLFKDAFNT